MIHYNFGWKHTNKATTLCRPFKENQINFLLYSKFYRRFYLIDQLKKKVELKTVI